MSNSEKVVPFDNGKNDAEGFEVDLPLVLRSARVIKDLSDGKYELLCVAGESIQAKIAYSCLLRPQVGDRVSFCQVSEIEYFILSILMREGGSEARLELPGTKALTVSAKELTLEGDNGVRIRSRKHIALSCLGDIQLSAKNFLSTVVQSLVQLAQHHISKADQISSTAKQLFRTHGHHQIITADEDIKIDSERINMG